MKGKIIYNPSGKAREYSEWAANFYNGCSNNCDYCYCKKGFLSRLWSTSPTLKAGLKSEAHALELFKHELDRNVGELRKSYLFFSFTTDPLLSSTRDLTIEATLYALSQGVKVSILTKCADMTPLVERVPEQQRRNVAVGFTLTGCDHMEPAASANKERMRAMRQMYILGFHVYASIEPVIDPKASVTAITLTSDFCELYKVGLLSGKKNYTRQDIEEMYKFLHTFKDCKFYLKQSFLSFIGLKRDDIRSNMFADADFDLYQRPTIKETLLKNPLLECYYNILFANDVACSMVLEAVAEIKRHPDMYRQQVKKKTKEVESIRCVHEKLTGSITNKDSMYFGDCVQCLMDTIKEDVVMLENEMAAILCGKIEPVTLFVKLETARLFVGIALIVYERRQEQLVKMGKPLIKEKFKLTRLKDAVNALCELAVKASRFEDSVYLTTERTSSIVSDISRKMADAQILQQCVSESEALNITEL